MAKKGDWVQIHNIVLDPAERSEALPEDTKVNPLEMWVKGHLLADAEIGDKVQVKTRTGRIASGTLVKVNPYFEHDFGVFVPEILEIDDMVRKLTFGGEE